MKKFDITALGEVLIDFTTIKNSQSEQKVFAQNPGGAPANVLVCASKLGAKTAFIGKVGDDMHGKFLENVISSQNVDASGLIFDQNYFTTLAFVDINENGEREFSFARKPGADTQISVDELNLELIKNSKIFHFGSLSLTDNPSKEATYHAIRVAKEAGAVISYDPNYREKLWKSKEQAMIEMRKPLEFIDIIKISDEECELLTDESDIYIASEILMNLGIKIVLITLGEKGALLGKDGCSIEIQGFKTKAIDTNGAGDSFFGSFLYNICKSNKEIDQISFDEAKEFVKFSNATSSLCVEKSGAIPAMPTLDDVLTRLS